FGWSIDTENRVVSHNGSNPNYSSLAKKDFQGVYSSDTFNQLSLTTRFLRSLKLFERQECQTLYEIPAKLLKRGNNL
ncbi:hypothetical protein AAXB25_29305, partial [Paenibacillus lautus]|uniref:hypothetical protein n=1 Tax=Paenibacillus lautus TaxID=1401 RepID=UPI003D2E25C3